MSGCAVLSPETASLVDALLARANGPPSASGGACPPAWRNNTGRTVVWERVTIGGGGGPCAPPPCAAPPACPPPPCAPAPPGGGAPGWTTSLPAGPSDPVRSAPQQRRERPRRLEPHSDAWNTTQSVGQTSVVVYAPRAEPGTSFPPYQPPWSEAPRAAPQYAPPSNPTPGRVVWSGQTGQTLVAAK